MMRCLNIVIGALALVLFSTNGLAQKAKPKPSKAVKADSEKVEDEAEPTAKPAVEAENADASKEKAREIALVSTMVLKVINPEDAREALERAVAKIGGFPILLTDESIQIKVPPEQLSGFLNVVARQGLVIEKSLTREDLTLQIAEIEGTLKSKLEILSRLRGFFDDSNLAATLRIEQTMNDLVLEIESIKGRLRVLHDRSKWALVDVYFQFRQRDRIVYVNSPFEWLNTVSLNRFLEEF